MASRSDDYDICPYCNGTGEGMHDGAVCSYCRGTGEVSGETTQENYPTDFWINDD